jgi:mono/diheme cytochrome c family protein/glucose/arabinose dehydrogenase
MKPDDDPSPLKSPKEELKSFQIEDGLEVQLVASEPMIQDPVLSIFDEKGRLWVVEMRGFMNDMDGKSEKEKSGRISVLEDTNADGLMDKSTVYLDSLEMPRTISLYKNGAIIAEKGNLWETADTNGDLICDKKTLIDGKYAANGLPEHSDNGMWRGIDNWFYNAKSNYRYKPEGDKWIKDSTEFRGQWGISHDDEGLLVYNYNWSQLHGDLVPPNYLFRNKNHKATIGIDYGLANDRKVFPIRPTPAVNRGYISGTLSKDGKLLEFTAACSPFIYRESTLSKEFYGNAFVCEPSGNLVKRNAVKKNGLLIEAKDPHSGREFMASTDERFRPVSISAGADGALYITDMYRGLIQHGAYVTPYLREMTIKRNLVLPVHCGRIWRVVPKNWKANKIENDFDSIDKLIANLKSSDGWKRDNAQRILVERNDAKSIESLKNIIKTDKNSLARFHALWTLEGMKKLHSDLLFSLLNDADTLVANNALRLIEPFIKTDKNLNKQVGNQLLKQFESASITASLQMALSAEGLENPAKFNLLIRIIEKHSESALIRDAVMSSLGNQENAFLNNLLKSKNWQNASPSKEIFIEILSMAITRKHDVTELNQVIASIDKNRKNLDWKSKAILTGISNVGKGKNKAIKLNFIPKLFTESDFNANRLTTLKSMFEWNGNTANANENTAKKSVLNEDEQKQFTLGRQHYLSSCSGCHGSDGKGINRFAPTLVASDWVLGDKKRLALIILHGIEGPIEVNKKVYDKPEILPVMPAHSTLDDGTITAILTYIRNEWGNNAGAMDRRTVGMTRIMAQGRVMPWTAKELDKYILDNQPSAEANKK